MALALLDAEDPRSASCGVRAERVEAFSPCADLDIERTQGVQRVADEIGAEIFITPDERFDTFEGALRGQLSESRVCSLGARPEMDVEPLQTRVGSTCS